MTNKTFTAAIILTSLLISTPVFADNNAPNTTGGNAPRTSAKTKCVKVTMVSFSSANGHQLSYGSFKGELKGYSEFLASKTKTFTVDGVQHPVQGTPDAFGIVHINLDEIG